jgi:hypothetical protein
VIAEFDFLCSLLRSEPDVVRARELQRGLNYSSLTNLAILHGVRPQLLGALQRSNLGDHGNFLDALKRFQRHHAHFRLLYAGELVRIAEAFDRRHIPFAVFKGVSLAVQLYGDVAGREFNDIDVIVKPEHLQNAEEALGSCGFNPRVANKAYRKTFLAYQQQYAFDSQSRVTLDLHWGFASRGTPFPIVPEEIWPNLTSLLLGGRAIPVLAEGDLALFLAGHGLKEGWRSLGWIHDFAMFVDRFHGVNWVEILHRA